MQYIIFCFRFEFKFEKSKKFSKKNIRVHINRFFRLFKERKLFQNCI